MGDYDAMMTIMMMMRMMTMMMRRMMMMMMMMMLGILFMAKANHLLGWRVCPLLPQRSQMSFSLLIVLIVVGFVAECTHPRVQLIIGWTLQDCEDSLK